MRPFRQPERLFGKCLTHWKRVKVILLCGLFHYREKKHFSRQSEPRNSPSAAGATSVNK
jgi:hypothetical protein